MYLIFLSLEVIWSKYHPKNYPQIYPFTLVFQMIKENVFYSIAIFISISYTYNKKVTFILFIETFSLFSTPYSPLTLLILVIIPYYVNSTGENESNILPCLILVFVIPIIYKKLNCFPYHTYFLSIFLSTFIMSKIVYIVEYKLKILSKEEAFHNKGN